MKILMATMGLDIGGAETHIVELLRELRRQGHDVAVASNGGAYVPEVLAAGARHYSVPMNRRSAGPMLKALVALRRIIREERPDVVHAHARIPGFLCGILQRTLRFPLVTTAHWVFDAGGLLGKLTNWGDRTIAVSEDIRRYLMDSYGLPEGQISVTINGIDTEKFSPAVSGAAVRAEFHIAETAPVVSHVSRLDENRALAARHLIQMAPALSERVPGVVILIAGGGDRFEELLAMAREVNGRLGRECVILTGPRTDINEIVAAGDCFVGVSRAALEAMSACQPVVIAGNEGYMGLFDEDKLAVGMEGNFCCRGCGDIEARRFLEDVAAALALPSAERQRLGQYGRAVVLEHYSVTRMAADALAAYRDAVGPRRFLMSGYYGFGNAGDEAILESVLSAVRETVPGAQVTVLSRSPENTAGTYGCQAVQRFDPLRVAAAVRRCQVLISGGGSLLQDATSTRSLWYYLAIIRMAQWAGKRVVLLANGVGPISHPGNRRRVKSAVERADVVTLRDAGSLETLREMGVMRSDIAVTADPVFLLPPPDPARTEEILRKSGVEGRFITVSVRPLEGGDFARSFARVCDELSEKYGVSTLFTPLQPARDLPVCREIMALMGTPAAALEGNYTARELMGVIGRGEILLSMRLHAIIFAACAAAPAVGFCYDPKVDAYLQMLELPSAGDAARIDEAAALSAASALLEHRDEAAARLREKRAQVTELARINLDILHKLY